MPLYFVQLFKKYLIMDFFLIDLVLETRADILKKFRFYFGRNDDTKRTFLNQLTFTLFCVFLNSKNIFWVVLLGGQFFLKNCNTEYVLPKIHFNSKSILLSKLHAFIVFFTSIFHFNNILSVCHQKKGSGSKQEGP